MHKKITRLPCFIFCFLFFACAERMHTRDKAVFHLNLVGGLESLDPAFAKDLSTMWCAHAIYNTLVETDAQLHLQPSLATRWEVSENGLVYTFYLRNDVFFQENKLFGDKPRKMIAGDVVYSFNRLMDPAVASTGAWVFNDRVAKKNPFVAINDTMLEIRLSKPFRPLPEILSMPYCSIVPQEVAEHWGKDYRNHPCGTGPFQFHYWDEGNVLILHKNPRYWQRDSSGISLPRIDAVQFSFFDNKATEFLLFLQGKLDFVNGVDGSFKDLVLTRKATLKPAYEKRITLLKNVYLNTEYLGFNIDTTNPQVAESPVRNVLIRRAINYAIDRKKMNTYFKNGMGIPATGGFIPPGMTGFDTVAHYGYDYHPAKALQLLEEAGYPNGKGLPPIKIITPDNYADLVNFVAGQLQDVGIKLQVEIMQPAILKEQMAKNQAVFFRAQWIADYPDAETYLTVFDSRLPSPPNYTRFHNKQFDAWYDQSMNANDEQRRILYRKMDSLAISMAPLVLLYYDQRMHFLQKNVSGFTSNPMNIIDLKWVTIR
ncbi:MAG TPA: ABC transporter substrate-binding protein [Flavipsychrobacter sp.]|nr:ABC transporter substrate-binding protein [Flavipsychrobacter sp.]